MTKPIQLSTIAAAAACCLAFGAARPAAGQLTFLGSNAPLIRHNNAFANVTAADLDGIVDGVLVERFRLQFGLPVLSDANARANFRHRYATALDRIHTIDTGSRYSRAELLDVMAHVVVANAILEHLHETGAIIHPLDTVGLLGTALDVDPEIVERVQDFDPSALLVNVAVVAPVEHPEGSPADMARQAALEMARQAALNAQYDAIVQDSMLGLAPAAWAVVGLCAVGALYYVSAMYQTISTTPAWADQDADGDGVKNGEDKYPHNPAKSCWPGPLYWPVATAMQPAVDASLTQAAWSMLRARDRTTWPLPPVLGVPAGVAASLSSVT